MSENIAGDSVPSVSDKGNAARLIYVLYLVALVIGVTSLVGVIMAYVYRDGAPAWVQSHYRYQIRTFWIGLLYVLIGAVTLVIVIGWFILLGWLIWYVIRCVKGLKLLSEGRAQPNPTSWWF